MGRRIGRLLLDALRAAHPPLKARTVPLPNVTNLATCNRRVAVASTAPGATSTAPATPGQRNPSSMAQSLSPSRGARTSTRSAGERPNRARPGGRASAPIHSTVPPARASTSAQKPAAASASPNTSSCTAARARPPPGSAWSIAAQRGRFWPARVPALHSCLAVRARSAASSAGRSMLGSGGFAVLMFALCSGDRPG